MKLKSKPEDRARCRKGLDTWPKKFLSLLSNRAHESALGFLVYTWRTVLWELSNWRKAATSILQFLGYISKLSLAIIFHFLGDPITSTITAIETTFHTLRAFYSQIVAYTPIPELSTVIMLTSLILAISEVASPSSLDNQWYMLIVSGLIGYFAVKGMIGDLPFWTILFGLFSFSRFIKKRDYVSSVTLKAMKSHNEQDNPKRLKSYENGCPRCAILLEEISFVRYGVIESGNRSMPLMNEIKNPYLFSLNLGSVQKSDSLSVQQRRQMNVTLDSYDSGRYRRAIVVETNFSLPTDCLPGWQELWTSLWEVLGSNLLACMMYRVIYPLWGEVSSLISASYASSRVLNSHVGDFPRKFHKKLGSFENSYIPENPRTSKPLTFLKNRLWEVKNRSNSSPFLKKINRFFGKKKFATGLVFERFLAPRSRFFEKVNGLGVLGVKITYSFFIPSNGEDQEVAMNDEQEVNDN
ncbi:hypothetical protein LXL04_017717 [Taraxacum kok-saghyz]